jgi:hypothetical protein
MTEKDTPTVYTLTLCEADCEQLSSLIRHEINYCQVIKTRIEKRITDCTDEIKHHPKSRYAAGNCERHIKSLTEIETELAEYLTLNEKLMSCGCKRATNWEGKIPGDKQ